MNFGFLKRIVTFGGADHVEELRHELVMLQGQQPRSRENLLRSAKINRELFSLSDNKERDIGYIESAETLERIAARKAP